ncbi:LysR family transcriptional regulator [Psychrobacillus sp. L3]|uniref:LysR family transcriptional regulator n=1 Tax=Psychrobacillus sp. L3 TaxID=3236891 RepID=UPI0036F39C0A
MNLHRLRCFIKVVEEGSITKAATSLQMTQPPLSILIRKFEEELNVTLFNRSGRHLELTPSGQFLYEQGKELIDISDNTERDLIEYHEGIRGTVKLGCITSASLFILPTVLKRLQVETPKIVTHVREGNSSYILEELRSLTIDIGIVRTSVRAEDIHTSTLLTEPLLLALPPNHYLCEKDFIEIADLENERFLLPTTSHGQGIADDIIEACQNSGFTPNVVYWGTETLPMLLMVMRGAGICFAPSCFKLFNSPELPVLRPLVSPVLQTKLSVVTLRDRYVSSISKRFLAITEEVAQKMTSIPKG